MDSNCGSKTAAVLYAGYQQYFLRMAGLLEQELGWKPVYWIVSPEIVEHTRQAYPDVVCHGHHDAIKGVPAPALKDVPRPALSGEELKELAFREAIALRMMERNDSHTDSFRHRDRVQFYYDQLRYWDAVLDHLDIDVVIFEEPPHQASDYILYTMARHRGVETVMFIRALREPLETGGLRMWFYPTSSFEEGSSLLKKAYRKALQSSGRQEGSLSPGVSAYLDALSGDFGDAMAVHLYNQIREAERLLGSGGGLLHRVRTHADALVRSGVWSRWVARLQLLLGRRGGFSNDQKQSGQPLQESRMSYLEHLFYKFRAVRRKRKMLGYYRRLAGNGVSLDGPFVLCPLHYQPEQTTSPLGDYFVDQLLMVEMISESLPDGWRLLVKDHVSQYVSNFARYGECFRTRTFFDRLTSFDNVDLVPLEQDTFELVDRSRAVATVTGTTGWEALVRGKPALVFGHAWYRDCAGVFYTPSKAALREAIDAIENGYRVDLRKVRLFAGAVEAESFAGMIGGPGNQQYYEVTEQENARAHADAVVRWWSK